MSKLIIKKTEFIGKDIENFYNSEKIAKKSSSHKLLIEVMKMEKYTSP
jgi:hypothetical protein